MNFSENLRYQMEEKKLNQAQLGKIAGVSQRTISSWLNGQNEPTVYSVAKLADYFAVSVDYLLGREDDLGNIVLSPLTANTPSALFLTSDEQELLNKYRKLEPASKQMILAVLNHTTSLEQKK